MNDEITSDKINAMADDICEVCKPNRECYGKTPCFKAKFIAKGLLDKGYIKADIVPIRDTKKETVKEAIQILDYETCRKIVEVTDCIHRSIELLTKE